MPVDPRTVKAATEFFRRVGFAAARGAAAEVERTAVDVAVPLLERASTIGQTLLETVRAAQAAAQARQRGGGRDP